MALDDDVQAAIQELGDRAGQRYVVAALPVEVMGRLTRMINEVGVDWYVADDGEDVDRPVLVAGLSSKAMEAGLERLHKVFRINAVAFWAFSALLLLTIALRGGAGMIAWYAWPAGFFAIGMLLSHGQLQSRRKHYRSLADNGM